MKKGYFRILCMTGLVLALLSGCAVAETQGSASVGVEAEAEKQGETQTSSHEEQTQSVQAEERDGNDLDSQTEKIIASMTREEKIYQLFIVTQEQITGGGQVTKSGEATKKAIERYPVGGIIYFEPNIVTPEQCSKMIENIQCYSRLGLFIAVDEEGGRVARLGNNPDMGTTAFPGGQAALGRTNDAEKAYEAGTTIATDISRFGFNLNLAPVSEITDDTEHSVIGERSFGGDPELVAQMVEQMVRGLHEGGVLCTLKHFPGHGDSTTDPHNGYVEMSKTLEELEQMDFVPFRAGVAAGADFLMMGHFAAPKVTGDDVPATLSKTWMDLAREELSFDGLIMTDSLSMGAITERYSAGEAAVMALEGGADVILMPSDLDEAFEAIEEALQSGELSEKRLDKSVHKIVKKKLESGILTKSLSQN